MLFQLLSNLIGDLNDHGLLSRGRKVELLDKSSRKLIGSDQGFVKIPQEAVLQPVLRCRLGLLVGRQVLINAKVARIAGCWQRSLRTERRNIQVDPYGYQRCRQRRLRVQLLLRQVALRLAHPFAPYALDLHRFIDLLSKFFLRCLLSVRIGVASLLRRTQASLSSRIVGVLDTIVRAVLGIVNGRGAAFRRAHGRDDILRLHWRENRVAVGANAWRVARHKGLGRGHPVGVHCRHGRVVICWTRFGLVMMVLRERKGSNSRSQSRGRSRRG